MLSYRQLLIILDVRTSGKINYNYTIIFSVIITNVLISQNAYFMHNWTGQ